MTDELTDHRAQRGFVLAAEKGAKIRQILKGKYLVPSATRTAGSYFVDLVANSCSCPDHEETSRRCKHIVAALTVSGALEKRSSVKSPKKKTYPQENWPAYRTSRLDERPTFERILRNLCRGIKDPPAAPTGRPRIPLSDVIYAAVLRSYLTMSGDRAHSDVVAAVEKGHIGKAAHPNTVFRVLRDPATIEILMGLIEASAAPLADYEDHCAIDSSGFPIGSYASWIAFKHQRKKKLKDGEEPIPEGEAQNQEGPDGNQRRRQLWTKLHIAVGVRTQIITAVYATTGNRNDTQFLKGLVETTSRNFAMKVIAADAGYPSEENLEAILGVGAEPRIQFHKSHKIRKHEPMDSTWNRMVGLYLFRREEFLKTYHVRSLSETVFSQLKRILGSLVRAKSSQGQLAESLLKALAHNIRILVQSIHLLGIEEDLWPLDKAS